MHLKSCLFFRSVQHENLYIDSKMKYCYSKGPVLTTPSNNDQP